MTAKMESHDQRLVAVLMKLQEAADLIAELPPDIRHEFSSHSIIIARLRQVARRVKIDEES